MGSACGEHGYQRRTASGSFKLLSKYFFPTGCTQIRLLCKNDVPTLLRKALPTEWLTGDKAQWYPGDGNLNHPSRDWLKRVWRYLRETFVTSDDLCRLENLPLIPLNFSQVPVILTRLKNPSKVVVSRLNSDRLNNLMVKTLKVLGVIIMQECPEILHPALLQTFVHPPSVQGVLHALTACSSTMSVGMLSAILLDKVDDVGKRSLRSFISKASSLNHEEKRLLLYLPIFETLSQTFVSKKEGLCSAPEDKLPVTPRREFIDIKDDDSQRLLRMLDIKIPSLTEFLCEEVFPDVKEGHYSGEEIDKLMSFVLERYHYHVGANDRFEEKIKDVPFVPTNGRRMRALDLFDPRKNLLKTLFAGEDVFPVGALYTDPSVLIILERLGMKSGLRPFAHI